MTSDIKEKSEEQLEKRILLLSFLTGVGFVIVELIYSIYSHSQSTLMDALYDASELIFIISTLFLTPLFHMRFRRNTLTDSFNWNLLLF